MSQETDIHARHARIQRVVAKLDFLVAKYARKAPPSMTADEVRAIAMFAVVRADEVYKPGPASFHTFALKYTEQAIRWQIKAERGQPEQLPEGSDLAELDIPVHRSVENFLEKLSFDERIAVEGSIMLGLTHGQLAERLGVSRRTVIRLVQGGLQTMRNGHSPRAVAPGKAEVLPIRGDMPEIATGQIKRKFASK